MPLDDDARKLRKWAATGIRAPLSRFTWAQGFLAAFRNALTPLLEEWNEIYCVITASLWDQRRYGILPWHAQQDYEEDAWVTQDGAAYRARIATGPTAGNVTTPGTETATPPANRIWLPAAGTTAAPNAPAAPVGIATQGRIVWTWNCPLDNGDEITTHNWRMREVGSPTWTRTGTEAHPRHEALNLQNGRQYEMQAQSVNMLGAGDWSPSGFATPVAQPPDKVLGLSARAGNGRVDLTFERPDDNGSPITATDVQWRFGTNNFGSLSAGYSGSPTAVAVTSLVNDREYFFRVRMRNARGSGPWSSVVSATPVAPVVPPPPTPHYSQVHRFTSSQRWNWPYDDPTNRAVVLLTGSSFGRNSGRDINLGNGNWSGAGSNGETIWITENTHPNYWARAYNASTLARDSSKDINLGAGAWNSCIYDGTTLFFVNVAGRVRAYNATTRARDAGKDFNLGSGSWSSGTYVDGNLFFVTDSNDNVRAYNAATRTRDASKDFNLGSGGWSAAASNGETMWFADHLGDRVVAYNAATRARDSSKDFRFGTELVRGMVVANANLHLLDDAADRLLAYQLASSSQITVDGATYSEDQDVRTVALSGLDRGDVVNVVIRSSAFVEVYPQAIGDPT